MPGDEVRLPAGRTLGARIKTARTQRGMTREATAALCGRSEEWLRQIERGRRGTSLHMVARLAEVLKVGDLTELLGDDAPTAVYVRPEHHALTKVRRALAGIGGAPPPGLDELRSRV